MEENLYYLLYDGNFPELSYLESEYLLKGIEPTIELEPYLALNETRIIGLKFPYLKTIKIFQRYTRFVSLTKEIGLFYFSVNYDKKGNFFKILSEINSKIDSNYLNFKIDQNTTFKVEMIKRGIINNLFNSENRQKLIYSVADNLISKFKLKTNLTNEYITITIILTPHKILVGQKLFKPNRKLIMNRTPSNRSYFHSGSMNPILIRAMINLGILNHYSPIRKQKIKKSYFLDPFMGAGGILMEAGTMGYFTLGIELGYWMSRGARMNLTDLTFSGYSGSFWSIIRSDSNLIPLKSESIDIIVTDPPYGNSTILGGQKLEDLLTNVLQECFRVLKKNSRMVISIPSQIKVNFNNFEILESISDRVHNSLTRIIYLLQK